MHGIGKVLTRKRTARLEHSSKSGRPPKVALPVVLFVLAIVVAAVMSPISSVPSASMTSPGSTSRTISHSSSGGQLSLGNTKLTSVSSGSWATQYDGFSVTGVSCPSTTSCFATGNLSEGGAVVTMSGPVWSSPTPLTNGGSLSAISCADASHCVAIGTNSSAALVLETTATGGSSWSNSAVPSLWASVSAISCPSDGLCVVGGYESNSGALAQLTLSGTAVTWGSPYQPIGNGGGATAVSCANTSYCAAAFGSADLFYSTNGGTSWASSDISDPTNDYSENVTGISCIANSSSAACTAVGSRTPEPSYPSIGMAWTTSNLAGSSLPANAFTSAGGSGSQVSCGSISMCLAVGVNGWYGPTLAAISTTGSSPVPPTIPVEYSGVYGNNAYMKFNAVACPSTTECVLGGPYGLDEMTNGASFSSVHLEIPGLVDVSCGSAQDCLAITSTGKFATTFNGGQLWLNLPAVISNSCSSGGGCYWPETVTCMGPTTCLADVEDYVSSSQVYVIGFETTDLGLQWTQITSPGAGYAPTYACAPSSTTCIGFSDYSVAVSTNAGSGTASTWTSVSGTGTSIGSAAAASCGTPTMCVVVGTGGGEETVTDTGGSWSVTGVGSGTTSNFTAISCPTSTMCMAGESSGSAYLLSFGGSGGNMSIGTGFSGSVNAVACDSATSCAAFSETSGAEYNGSSFSAIAMNPNTTIDGAACGAPGRCYAVGSGEGASLVGQLGVGSAVVLATDGLVAPTFLPPGLIAADSFGGPDGSRPCLSCALKQMGYAAEAFVAEPINTADGDFYESIPLVSVPGKGPEISFTATYDSQRAQSQVANGVSYPGALGFGWSWNDAMSLSGAGGTGNITVNEEGGAQVTYQPTATGPGFGGASCTSVTGSVQCYTATESDVTAIVEENLTSSVYLFSRDNGKTKYAFNTTGQLTSITDANGYTESFAYGVTTGTNCSAAYTACNTATDASGRTLDIVYSTLFAVMIKIVDPAGRTWSFTLGSNANLTGIENPRSLNETFAYADTTYIHNMTSLELPNGQSGGPDAGDHYTMAYEDSATSSVAPGGYIISQQDPAGLTTSFSYAGNNMSPTGGTTTITDPHGNLSEDQYVNGVLIGHVVDPSAPVPAQTSFVRNSMDMPVTIVDPDGHASSATYDADGNMLTSTDASNNTWTYTYNQFNEVLTASPPTGSTKPETVDTYDSAGNLLTTTQHPSSGSDLTTTYHYSGSPAGLPSSVTDPKGNSTSFTYDSYGDLATSTTDLGNESTFAYTNVGQLFCSTIPKATAAGAACPSSPSTRVSNTTSETFDSSDTLEATSTDPNGKTTNYGYDNDGNETTVEDPLGNYTAYAFDADDRTTAEVDGFFTSAASETTTTYDVAPSSTNANCSSTVTGATYCTDVVTAAGTSIAATTAYYYDAFGNLVQTTDPGGDITTDAYDPVGNLETSTTAAGTTTYTYQPNNWLSGETFSAGTGYPAPSSVSYTYYGDGVRNTMVDGTGPTTYDYDGYGRLQSVVNGAGKQVTYGYDTASNLTCMSYPNSGTSNCQNASSGTGIIAYGYDNDNRMTSLTDWNSKQITFAYNPNGDWYSTTYPTTTATTMVQAYGNVDNLIKETTTNSNLSGGSQITTWAPNADEQFASTQANSGTVENYGYNTLTQATSLAGSDSYAYNQVGEMTSDTPSGGSATDYGYTTDEALCYSGTTTGTCASPPSGATRYLANSLNDRCYSTTSTSTGTCASPPSSSTTQSYGYDQLGDLTCATAPNSSGYNCTTKNASKTTTYAYNGDGLRTSDVPAGGSSQQFTWDVSTSTPSLLSDGTNSYLYGPNGTPVEQIVTSSSTASYLVSDPTGLRYQFTAAGGITGSNAYNPYGKCTSCTATTPFGFEDGYTDPNGLVYLVHRYYDPTTAQFLSVDPLVAHTGQPFSYANDDPVNLSDPSGDAGKAGPIATVCAALGLALPLLCPTSNPEPPVDRHNQPTQEFPQDSGAPEGPEAHAPKKPVARLGPNEGQPISPFSNPLGQLRTDVQTCIEQVHQATQTWGPAGVVITVVVGGGLGLLEFAGAF